MGAPLDIDCGGGLADNFRYWRGASGAKYVFTEIALTEIGDYTETVVMLLDARRRSSGPKLAYLGEAESAHIDSTRKGTAPNRKLCMRAFVHLLAVDADRRKQVIADLAAAA